MRTTLNLDEKLISRARKVSGIKEKTKLLHLGLEALIQREASIKLSKMGGTMPDLKIALRRRSIPRA